ncbi:hypothetical protein O9H85_00945 [Paenibacillus filicis]|uniref:Uncharacterized protein n=1 Tax=Paenibacillus gyeongsangnamensis TaxID=3388067 RepID=A0ABT4Q2A9_9BACL|nr:hypothetical protein [Paenibacillus filicis]MCZ8511023.1 hypothetical protein [Paenibacillus filicis]
MQNNPSYEQFLQEQQAMRMQQSMQAQQALHASGASTYSQQLRDTRQQLLQVQENLQQAQAQVQVQLDAQIRRLLEIEQRLGKSIQYLDNVIQQSQSQGYPLA